MQWADEHPWVVTGGISAVAAIVAVSVAILLYRKGRSVRVIDYVIVNDVDILSRHAASISDLRIEFRGHALKSPRIVTIKFMNAGNAAISREDYAELIRVRHGGDIRTLDAYIVDQSTSGIVDTVYETAAGSRHVEISPKLFNAGEDFTVQFLYDGREKLEVGCRFKDQAQPMMERTTSTPILSLSDAEFYRALRNVRNPFECLIYLFARFLARLVLR